MSRVNRGYVIDQELRISNVVIVLFDSAIGLNKQQKENKEVAAQ